MQLVAKFQICILLLDMFCQFEAGVPEFDAVFSVKITSTAIVGRGMSNAENSLIENTTTTPFCCP
jgi:hypothetical protein